MIVVALADSEWGLYRNPRYDRVEACLGATNPNFHPHARVLIPWLLFKPQTTKPLRDQNFLCRSSRCY